jgi:nitrate reductase NapE component
MLALVSASPELSHAERPTPGSTQASPTKADCIQAHKLCQQAQNDGRLVEARAWATSCTKPACPGLLVTDCARWLNELGQRIPSVVFDVRAGGHPSIKAEVYADGQRVESWTRGEALRLDPGQHAFRFVLAPFSPSTETMLLGEGMRFRVVSVELAMPERATPSHQGPVSARDRAAGTARPVPVVVYPLLGVGVVGIAGFVGFGLSGKAEQRRLERTCSPDCSESDLSTMRQRYLIGDISAAVGVGAMVGAGVLYLFRPKRPTRESVSVTALPGGGSMALAAYRF